MSDVRPDRHRSFGERGMLALAGLILIGTSIWFATSWIDVSTAATDATCGWLFRTDIWMDESTPPTCRTVMPIRAGMAAALLAAGLALIYLALRGRPRSRSTVALVLAAATVVAAIVLTINEAVRSDGAWRSRHASGDIDASDDRRAVSPPRSTNGAAKLIAALSRPTDRKSINDTRH